MLFLQKLVHCLYMKFLTTTSSFLLALLLCMPAHTIQAGMVRRRRKFKQTNVEQIRSQRKSDTLKVKKSRKKGIGPVQLVMAFFLCLFIGIAISMSFLPESNERYEKKKGDSDEEVIKGFLYHIVPKDGFKKVGSNAQHDFFNFVIDVYLKRNLNTYLGGFHGKNKEKEKKLYVDFFRNVIDYIITDKKLFPDRNAQQKEINKVCEQLGECGVGSLSNLNALLARYNGVQSDSIEVQAEKSIEAIKTTVLQSMIGQYDNKYVEKPENGTPAEYQLEHLKNIYILHFAKKLGFDTKVAKADRFIRGDNNKTLNPNLKIGDNEFIEKFKEKMNEEIAALVTSIMGDVKPETKPVEAYFTWTAMENYIKNRREINQSKAKKPDTEKSNTEKATNYKKVDEVIRYLQRGDYFGYDYKKNRYFVTEPAVYCFLEELGFIKGCISYVDKKRQLFPENKKKSDKKEEESDKHNMKEQKFEFTERIYTREKK